jgi:Uncharacterized protein conserved in bacteria
MKKLIVFAVAVMMSGIFSIQAAEPEKDGDMEVRIKLASELLQTIQVDKILTQTFDSMKEMQKQTIMKMAKDPESQAIAVEIQEKVIDLMKKEMSWEILKPEFERLYAETYSAEELDGLLKFYQSPLGKKFIEKQPEMQRKTMMMVQQMMMRIMPKIQALTMELEKKARDAAKKTEPADESENKTQENMEN